MIGQKIIIQIGLRLVNAAIGFFSTILVARVFLPETIGNVVFIIGICSFPLLFFDLGINTAANTKIALGKFTPAANLGILIYSKLLLTILYAALTIFVFIVNRQRINEIGLPIFFIIASSLYVEAFVTSLQTYFVGLGHFYKYMISNFIAQLGGSLFLVGICLLAPTVLNYAAANLVRSILLLALLFYYLRGVKINWHINSDIINDYIAYLKPLLILTPIYGFIGSAEKVMLPYLISSFSLGIFTIGVKFYDLLELAKKTYTSYMHTYICKLIARYQGDKLHFFLNNLIIISHIFGCVLIVGFINRMPTLTVLAFSEKFAAAAIVTQLMLVWLYLELTFSGYAQIIYAKEKQKSLIMPTIIGGIVLIIASAVLIPHELFGIRLLGLQQVGMPLAQLFRFFVIGGIVVLAITKKLIGKNFFGTQIIYTIYFLIYIIADHVLLSIAPHQLVWTFFSWIIGIVIYLTIAIKLLINDEIKREIKDLFSIKKFKEGLKEI